MLFFTGALIVALAFWSILTHGYITESPKGGTIRDYCKRTGYPEWRVLTRLGLSLLALFIGAGLMVIGLLLTFVSIIR